MTIINFEGIAVGTTVTTQFSQVGVIFPNGAFVDSDSAARSGSHVLKSDNPEREFDTGPLVFEFLSGQSVVRFWAGGVSVAKTATARAFDQAGNVIFQDGPKNIQPGGFTTDFELSASSASLIWRVEFKAGITTFEAIDDLEFIGGSTPDLPSTSPVLMIAAPEDSAELDLQTLSISGSVSGTGVLGPVHIIIDTALWPGSLAPPSENTVPLSGTEPDLSFSMEMIAPVGPVTISAHVENIAGLIGSDSVDIINLPSAVRARHASDGGTAVFGELQYALRGGGCTLAIYEHAMIGLVDGNTYRVNGAIFKKWLDTVDDFNHPGRLGCPLGESYEPAPSITVQRFRDGDIYSSIHGTYYVPAVFTAAIDELGSYEGFGVPVGDPSSSAGVHQTWLFQRFTRPEQPQLLESTIEICGTPPELRVARQGGDLKLFTGIPLGPTIPTLCRTFSCDAFDGPCQIQLPVPGKRLSNAGVTYCGGESWDSGGFTPPYWSAVLGDNMVTTASGIIASSHPAEWDMPLVHEHYGELPKFPSDWNLDIRLLVEYEHLLTPDRDTLHVEWEKYFSGIVFAHPSLGIPTRGDLAVIAGRWVVDCGHGTFKTEIHPPALVARMMTGTLDNGRPTTEARIWVNGYFPGSKVEFDIHPPPRPHPEALLNLEKPVDADASVGIDVAYKMLPPAWPNRVRISFSAPWRENIVDDNGMMAWQYGRAYYGRWRVWWT